MTKADTKYREDIIRMARQAGWEKEDSLVLDPQVIWYISQGQLERFAKLVAAQEREACAKVCDELDAMNWSESGEYASGYGDELRKRGKQ